MERMGIYLTDIQIRKLRAIQKKIGKKSGLSVAYFIRQAIDQWLERYEKGERKQK